MLTITKPKASTENQRMIQPINQSLPIVQSAKQLTLVVPQSPWMSKFNDSGEACARVKIPPPHPSPPPPLHTHTYTISSY